MPDHLPDRQTFPGQRAKQNLIDAVGSLPPQPRDFRPNSGPNPSLIRLDGPGGSTGGLMKEQTIHGLPKRDRRGWAPTGFLASSPRAVT